MIKPCDSGVTTKTLLMSDLVGSMHLTEQLGEKRAAHIFGRHDAQARDLLVTTEGWEVDKSDGFLMLFDEPLQAVCFALAYHRAMGRLTRREDARLEARIAIHQGKVLLRRNPPQHVARGAKPIEVEGLAKPLTARLMRLAAPRQTLLTLGALGCLLQSSTPDERRADLPDGLVWRAHGRYRLQGLQHPIQVFEVGLRGTAPLCRPGDITKARCLQGDHTIPVLGM